MVRTNPIVTSADLKRYLDTDPGRALLAQHGFRRSRDILLRPNEGTSEVPGIVLIRKGLLGAGQEVAHLAMGIKGELQVHNHTGDTAKSHLSQLGEALQRALPRIRSVEHQTHYK
ncbi:MAG: hypothetical protein V1722_02190 [Candidatus Micrarchaeota archaeon]